MNIFKNVVVILILTTNFVFAQVKIGDNPGIIDESSLLELESNSRTFVLSRVKTTEMQGISPLEGAILYNSDDGCVYYYDGEEWNSLCTSSVGFSFLDNEDGTFTLDTANDAPITFDGAPETISTLVDNGNSTYTYTNEVGDETNISAGGSGGIAITDNGDGTFTVDDGVTAPFNFNGAPETISTIVDNGNGTYTYTNEAGTETTVVSGGPGGLSITDNGDGTFTVDDGVDPLFDFDGAPETLSTLDENGGTFTYTDESGAETSFFIGGATGQHFGTSGSVFFANATTGEPTEAVGEFFWDDVNKRLEIVTTPGAIGLEVGGTTRSQRVSSGSGAATFPGYHFVDSFNSGLFALPAPSSDIGLASGGQEVVRISSNPALRVGINQQNPLATLHVGGDLVVDGTITNGSGTILVSKSGSTSKSIRRISAKEALVSEFDDTIILDDSVQQLNMPVANSRNLGKIIIIKDLGGAITNLNLPYRNIRNEEVSIIDKPTVIWLQSDGKEWQQIN